MVGPFLSFHQQRWWIHVSKRFWERVPGPPWTRARWICLCHVGGKCLERVLAPHLSLTAHHGERSVRMRMRGDETLAGTQTTW